MTRPPRLPEAAICVAALSLAWLHAIHMVAGHAWFANYGLLAASLPAAVIAYATLARYGTRSVTVGVTAAMLMLFLLAEWLEGELAADHRLSWPTISDHGWPVLVAAGVFAGCALLVETARLMRLLRHTLDGR